MNDDRPRFAAADLRRFTAAVFRHYGVDGADADAGAEVLIDADLAGIESHGIAHLPWHPGYAPGLKRGIVDPSCRVEVLREAPSTAAWDSHGGLGVVVARRAMEACIGKAEATGIGMVTVRNGRHFGAAGYYARMAAERSCIGMAMCNVPPIAAAAGGLDRVFGTNPIAMAAPVAGGPPFLLDMATTAVAGGKLEIAQRQGKRLPAGWAIDAEGNDFDDPEALRKGGALLPLGSRPETSSYKGYGLGLMVDILSGILGGGGSALFSDRSVIAQGFWFAAWRIDAFVERAEFEAEMKKAMDHIRATRPAPGRAAVLVAGDPEWAARADREARGVPLDEATVAQLSELAAETGVVPPTPLA